MNLVNEQVRRCKKRERGGWGERARKKKGGGGGGFAWINKERMIQERYKFMDEMDQEGKVKGLGVGVGAGG